MGRTPAHPRFTRQDYDEYKRLMTSLDFGIPILKPCPTAPTNSAAIGDVGYMRDGEFVKLDNINALAGRNAPKFNPKSALFKPAGNPRVDGMGAILCESAGIQSNLSPAEGSELHNVAVGPNTTSGVALFPLYGFQLESIVKGDKDSLCGSMKEAIKRCTLPPGLTTNDLLLVHSRVMAAKWMMVRFTVKRKGNSTQAVKFSVCRDGALVNLPSGSIDFAVEQGVDPLALQGPKPKKSESTQPLSDTAAAPNPLGDASPIRTSNCVFLGAFRMLTSGEVDDTAKSLVMA